MISIDDDLKGFGKATFSLLIINFYKDEYIINRSKNNRHIKKDFIEYINHLTIELLDRNRLFSKAFYHYLHREQEFTPKIVISFILHVKNNFIDTFARKYKIFYLEYQELKKIKITKSNEYEVIEKIVNFNQLSKDLHYTYLEYQDGFLDYIIDYLELLGLDYSPNIERIATLNMSEIEFITETKKYIDKIFSHYHRFEIIFNSLERET